MTTLTAQQHIKKADKLLADATDSNWVKAAKDDARDLAQLHATMAVAKILINQGVE